jgi:hypothetical protein
MCHVWGRGEVHTEISRGTLREGNQFEKKDMDGRTILQWAFKMLDGSMDCNDRSQNRDRWEAIVNAVMNFRVLKNVGNFLTS